MNTYAKEEIRKALMQYHNLDGNNQLVGIDGVRKVMEKLQSIQYDPLNVVGRNADLVLQARISNYQESYLYDLLYKEHSLLDGYDKEMCIYNTSEFGHFAPVRKERTEAVVNMLRNRGQLGIFDILDEVEAFVKKNGPTGTKDISIGEAYQNSWGHKKLSSAALDYLYNAGKLCVVNKRGTQKYFDMTERIIKEDSKSLEEMPIEEFLEWYVERRIRSVGMIWNKNGGAWQGHFLCDKELRNRVLSQLEEKGLVNTFQIEGISEVFYSCKEFAINDSNQKQEDYARFIAPLDNVLWDRALAKKIFDFEYSWEVYTPVVKRKYGYYVIPVLHNNHFVARFEPEPVSKAGCFRIKNWWWEPNVKRSDRMIHVIQNEMKHFSKYLQVVNDENNLTKAMP